MKVDREMLIELDPYILSTSFGVQTNWQVITGGACCGKTTLIDLLADKGFQTVPEIPRQYIEREVAKGRTLDELFGSEADERAITDMQRRTEHGLRATDVVFLDRALPDFLWFWRLLGLDPNELLAECFTIVMLPYFYSTCSPFSWTAPGSKMRLIQFYTMSGWSAITAPWDIAL